MKRYIICDRRTVVREVRMTEVAYPSPEMVQEDYEKGLVSGPIIAEEGDVNVRIEHVPGEP